MASALMVACGGGGGTATSSNGAPGANAISGIASDGPLNGSSVCAYAITASGVQGAQIGSCATTDSAGNYSINLGTYTGPVMLQATGGNYVDEATGTTSALALPLDSIIVERIGRPCQRGNHPLDRVGI